MKTKFMAGLVATIISIVLMIALAILVVAFFDSNRSDGLAKILGIALMTIWVGLYTWLKPKGQPGIFEKYRQEINERDQQKKESEKVEEKKSERNSYQ